MQRFSERDAVELFKARFAQPGVSTTVGIGDDAAVLESEGAPWVCSVDACVEGVHFDYAYLSLEDIGYRSFQAALSDLAAMGATPVAALSSLIVPRGFARSSLEALSLGQAQAAQAGACPIVGGNVSRGRELSITTTVLGRAEHPLLRSGAKPGQEVWLVGEVGMAALGLARLRGRQRAEPHALAESEVTRASADCIERWRRPRALVREGLQLVGVATCAIDISDGLAAEAVRIAEASGARVSIERELLRAALSPSLLVASRACRRSALAFALYGGEDYALLATGPHALRPEGAACIGHVSDGRGAWLVEQGYRTPLRGGYDHLASRF